MPGSSSLAGRYYMCVTPPPELDRLPCWTEDIAKKFLAERVPISKRILTAQRRADMKQWLLHPDVTSKDKNLAVRQKFANDKAWTNKSFELQAGQIYHKAERIKGKWINA
jgi:hypothetical protein